MAGGPVCKRKSVTGGRRRIEVSMRAAEALVVVSDAESVLLVKGAVDLPEGRVLIKAAGKRAGCSLYLRRQLRVIGEEIGRQAIDGRAVVDRQRFVADLALEIAQIEKAIMDERAAYRATDLLPAIVGFGDSLLLVDLVVGAGC